jgi:Ca-activated chloride channel homolog
VNFSPEFSAGEPNLNLLRRIAESGGGRVLDPTQPDNNPFTHDRTKTYQPRDLWEWLLKLAVILFVVDVGVRRIQIDRDEMWRATQALRRWIFFWQGAARPPVAEESLASLLARRGEVRATKTAAGDEARPELFQPQQPGAAVELPGSEPHEATSRPAFAPKDEPKSEETGKPENTTSRLLEAKRRARKRREK